MRLSHRSDPLKLAAEERRLTESLPVHLADNSRSSATGVMPRVLLVGAGAVNLVAAWFLRRAGWNVAIVDARPDPLREPEWQDMGCTFGGYGARIFSLTEARQHHRREGVATGASAYRRPIAEGGWLCCPPGDLDATDWSWIEDHECVPGWLLREYGKDIESFNVESDLLWGEMRDAEPELFRDVAYVNRLVRIYPDKDAVDRAAAHESSISPPPRRLSPEELQVELPALAAAVGKGEVGGALAVRGFSLDVHAFGRKLIEVLSARNVVFRWSTKVEAIVKGKDGCVTGLNSTAGPMSAQAYVLSPGAYGGDLLAGTKSERRVAAVAGGWVSIVNANPALDIPLKISRRGFAAPGSAEGANVIPAGGIHGRPRLHISSGHGYLGSRPENLRAAYLDGLTEAARQTARRYFPAQTEASCDFVTESERYCIRPWTSTGLGLFETMLAADGGLLVVSTGHNTGGFAQSPAIAQAVLAALSGRQHVMHTLYHPDRASIIAAL